jgi:hypothetical protein
MAGRALDGLGREALRLVQASGRDAATRGDDQLDGGIRDALAL